MKKLNNKKGFTLIEMLVVIAIIAVLVAIIIPVVTSATDKAAAATNAANLRSYKAEIVTSYLSNDGKVTVSGSNVTCTLTTPAMKEVKNGAAACAAANAGLTPNANGSGWTLTYDTTKNDFVLEYNSLDVDDFATVAGQKAETPASKPPQNQGGNTGNTGEGGTT